MSASCVETTSYAGTTCNEVVDRYVFVLQQHNGTFLIGVSPKPTFRITQINSGKHHFVKTPMTVNRVIGIKPVNQERSLTSVVNKFISLYGEDKVVAV